MRGWIFGASGLLAIATLVVACGVGTDCDSGLCAGPIVKPDGGRDGPPAIPADCILTKSPKESKACVDDSVGIFVDRNGKTGAAGTMRDPLPSIGAAVTKATSSQRTRVYICDGKYEEVIVLNSPISIYGGFDCSWTNTGLKPRVSPLKGVALELRSISDEVVIEDIDVTGLSDANTKGASGIGAVVVDSKLTLRGVIITAGQGQEGAKGSSRSNYLTAAAAGLPASGTTGGADQTCSCADGTKSIGGHGADGDGTKESDGASAPPVGLPNAGATMPSACNPGLGGAQGDAATASEPVPPPGLIVDSGWEASKLGESGKNGRPGQGGGGGGAKTMFLTPGGGGGCGGCGGAGGAAGGNGGASIALISVRSTVTAELGSLSSVGGGKGGAGGDGQPGQGGGAAGGSGGCAGGGGGAGAGGGGGAGGAGGDSFAVASMGGNEPVLKGTDTKPGTGGRPGDGGGPGTGNGTSGLVGKNGLPGRQAPKFRQ